MSAWKAVVVLSLFILSCGQTPRSGINTPSGCTGVDCPPATKASYPTQAILTHRQIIPNYQRCLGMAAAQIKPATHAAVEASRSILSAEGRADEISGPMLLAITKVAGEVCQNLIDAERNSNSRKFFLGFTFTGFTNTQTYKVDTTVQNFAKACWGRTATTVEIEDVKTSLNSSSIAAKSEQSAIYICTAMLSSARAIQF